MFFLLFEELLTDKLNKNKYLDNKSIPILVSTLSLSISLFISSYITQLISSKIDLIKSPIIDSIGFSIGKLTVALIYIIYINNYKRILNKKELNEKNNNS